MNRLWQDLRYATRNLLARPAFALASILSLALGIGACAAIFSIVDAVLLRPLPYPDAARVVELKEISAKGTRMNFAEPNFADLRARNHSLEAMAQYNAANASTMLKTVTIVGASKPERVPVYAVSSEFFGVLGVAPVVGRGFLPEELNSGTPVAILSYGFWQRSLGGKTDLETSRTAHNWGVIARLRPGISLAAARADVSAIGKQLKVENGEGTWASDFALIPLQEYVVGSVQPALLAILAAVGFLLLVASTNVSNLRLAQMTARQKEFAVRAALGAGRLRLAQQFLTENLLLAVLGGAGGVLLSFFGVDLMLRLNQGNLPRAGEISVNPRAFSFAFALSVLIAVMLGVVSVLHFAHRDLQDGLKESARGQTANVASRRLRGFFVVAQVALTLILLVGAGLLGRSFVQLLRVDPGFRPDSAVAMNLSLPAPNDRGFVALPTSDDKNQQQLRGRVFDSTDGPNAPPAAVISQALAQKYFPGTDPIGKHIQFGNMDGDERLLEIVGMVGNVREGLDDVPALTIYANAFQRPQAYALSIVVRAQADPATLVPAMRQTTRSLNPELPMTFRTLGDIYSASLDVRRFSFVIFGVFAAVTLILAMLGLYSVISYTVAQRTREIGIRRALGAQGRDVLGLVVRRGMTLTLCGVAFGLAGSLALTRLMTSLLFGVTGHDPATLAGVTLLLATVALIACLVPARRATKVDPLVALRYE